MRFQTIRGTNGSIVAGRVTFDVNYRFPGATTFTGLHIHDQVAGQNGPVRINTGITGNATVVSESGFGNIYIPVLVNDMAGLASLNSLVATPERHYTNLHSTVNPGGAVRAQLSTAMERPTVSSVHSGATASVAAVAPGGSMTINGTNFTQVSTDTYFSWEGLRYPNALNGVEVTVGGRAAPVFSVAPTRVDVQVPAEVTAGSQPVVVKTASGESTAVNATVQATAPAIYLLDATQGQVVRVSNLGFVGPGNAASAGDLLIVFLTGMGATTPPLTTGAIVTNMTTATGPATATIGGRDATVAASLAYPGSAAQYVAIVTVPGGLTGMQPLQVSIGGQRSNSAMVLIQ